MEKQNSVEEEKGSNDWVTQVVECSMQRAETARLLPLKFGVVSGSMTMPVFVRPVGVGLRISRPCPARLTSADLSHVVFLYRRLLLTATIVLCSTSGTSYSFGQVVRCSVTRVLSGRVLIRSCNEREPTRPQLSMDAALCLVRIVHFCND
jgi:hypothetical protein